MAIYKVQGPNGEIIGIEGPDNANPNDVIAQAQSLCQPKKAPERTLADRALGVGETAATIGSGLIAAPMAAIAGIKEGLFGGNYGTRQGAKNMENVASQVMSNLTYQPRTEAGQEYVKDVGQALEASKIPPFMPGMIGFAPLAGPAQQQATQMATQAARAVAGPVKSAAAMPFQAARGAFNAATGGETALVPMTKTYITPEGASLFKSGAIDIPTVESAQYTRPVSELPTNAVEQAALKMAGNQMPVGGKGAQAFGERVAQDWMKNPYKAAVDIGVPLLTGMPISPFTMARGAQALGDVLLARKGFDPTLPQDIARAKGQAGLQASIPTQPALTYSPAQPAVSGAVKPTMYVSPEGQVAPNLQQATEAGLQQKYAPQPVAPVAPETMAAAKINPVGTSPAAQAAIDKSVSQAKPLTVAPTVGETAEQLVSKQAILDLINQKRGITSEPAPSVTGAVVPSAEMPKSTDIRPEIKLSSLGGVRGKDGIVQVNQTLFNDIADKYGFKSIDWSKAPDVINMGVGDARKEIALFVDNQFKDQYTKGTRTSQTSVVKQAEAGKTAERLAAEDAAALARVAKFANPNSPVNKSLKDTMSMITNDADALEKIKNAPWLTPEEFNQEMFMHNLGSKSNQEFVAKMKTPEGSIIKAVDKKLDSEAIKYAGGDAFMIKNYRNTNQNDYSIFNKDGTRYEIQKVGDDITKIELRKGDNLVALYEYSPMSTLKPSWAVKQELPSGGGMLVYDTDVKTIGNANTRRLHNELPKIDFNKIITEQLARAQALKEGK